MNRETLKLIRTLLINYKDKDTCSLIELSLIHKCINVLDTEIGMET